MSNPNMGPVSSGVLTSGSAVVVPMRGVGYPRTVWVNPAAGDTVTVEYQPGPGGPWVAWPNGAATAFSSAVIDAPVEGVRFTRSSGAGITSAYGVQ